MIKVAYVAGFGRSGSTLLDRALSRLPGVKGFGEFAFLPELMAQQNELVCSCGGSVFECPVWGSVIEAVLPMVRSAGGWHAIAKRRQAIEAGSGPVDEVQIAEHNQFNRLIMDTLLGNCPSVEVIVDSSKTARLARLRPLALAAVADVRLIHLVRDGRAVLWSVGRGSNRALERGEVNKPRAPALRTIAGYTAAHLAANAAGRRLPATSYMRIHYESFVDSPDETLRTCAEFLGIQYERNWRDAESGVEHRFAGNRNRSDPTLTFRPDNEWRVNLSVRTRLLWSIFGLPARLMTR